MRIKKAQLRELVLGMLREAFAEEAARKPRSSALYRRSKQHPEEKARKLAARAAKKTDIPLVRRNKLDGPMMGLSDPAAPSSAVFDNSLLNAIETVLLTLPKYGAHQMQVFDPKSKKYLMPPNDLQRNTALKAATAVLAGQNVMKKDLMTLAQFIIGHRIIPQMTLRILLRGLADLHAKNAHGH